MSAADQAGELSERHRADVAPGEAYLEVDIAKGLRGYLIGLGLAVLLTACSFAVVSMNFVWGSGSVWIMANMNHNMMHRPAAGQSQPHGHH